MDETQRFLFDTFGYFTIPGVLSMPQVEELRATLQQPTEQFAPVDKQAGPLHWGEIWRDLLDLPNVSPIVEELTGNHGLLAARQAQRGEEALPTFRIDHINVHTHVENGFPGSILHGGWKGTGGSQFFRYHDGQFYNGLIVVAIELFDTQPNDGGFCCIPGSHKGNVPLPESWQDLREGVHPSVTRVPASAGDAIIFTEALTHGTLPWTVDAPRQTLFYKFSPHGTTWSADFFDPADFTQYEDVDNRKRAILEPPNARYHGRPTRPDWQS
jgi:hypothetical protein